MSPRSVVAMHPRQMKPGSRRGEGENNEIHDIGVAFADFDLNIFPIFLAQPGMSHRSISGGNRYTNDFHIHRAMQSGTPRWDTLPKLPDDHSSTCSINK